MAAARSPIASADFGLGGAALLIGVLDFLGAFGVVFFLCSFMGIVIGDIVAIAGSGSALCESY